MDEEGKEIIREYEEVSRELLERLDFLVDSVVTLSNEIKKVVNPVLVKAIATMNEKEKALVGWMLDKSKRNFILTYHHRDWVREVVVSLTDKNIFETELRVIDKFSSGTFGINVETCKFLYHSREHFKSFSDTIESEFDLYKESDCDTLLCKANTFSKNHNLPEVTANQILGKERLPDKFNKEAFEVVVSDRVSKEKELGVAKLKDC